jgi:hypothetical protein
MNHHDTTGLRAMSVTILTAGLFLIFGPVF